MHAWVLVVVSMSCVVARWGMHASVKTREMPNEVILSKARFRDAMYQLSLRFAWKWGVEHGGAYRALDIFRREIFRLSEDLRNLAFGNVD